MRILLLITSIALFMTAVVLFVLPTDIPTVEIYYSSSFILALILLGVADFMKFKMTSKLNKY